VADHPELGEDTAQPGVAYRLVAVVDRFAPAVALALAYLILGAYLCLVLALVGWPW
jgi:hypothetical protein